MIVCPYNESFLVLVLQTDHSRIARTSSRPLNATINLRVSIHTPRWCSPPKSTTAVGGIGRSSLLLTNKVTHRITSASSYLGQGVWLDLYRRAIDDAAGISRRVFCIDAW